MWVVQLLLAGLLVIPLSYGPVGHYLTLGRGGIDLSVITIWLFSWLTDDRTSYRWAIILGLLTDFVSFLPFGFWTIVFIVLTWLILYVKTRFFEVSSLVEALLTLLGASLLLDLVSFALTQQLNFLAVVISLVANVLFGLLLYYVLAIRFRLFQRWQGRIL